MIDQAAGALLEVDILASAKDHGGRYLLRRRRRSRARERGFEPDSEDLKIEACERLVDRREARWISRDSTMWPGIELAPGWDRPYQPAA